MKNVDLNTENQRLQNRIRVLERISQLSVSSYGVNYILDTCLDMIVTMMNCDAGSVIYAPEDDIEMVFLSAVGKAGDKIKRFTLQKGEGIAGWVIETGETIIVPDVYKDNRFAAHFPKLLNYETMNILAAPIFVKGRVMGALELVNRVTEAPFSDEDKISGEHFANLLAMILENFDLRKSTKGRLAELETLVYVSQVVNSNLEIKTLMETVVRLVKEVMRVEGCSIMIFNPEKGALEFSVAQGEVGEKVKEFTLKPGEGVAGLVFQSGEPLIINDAINDPRVYKQVDESTGFETKSILCVPLRLRDKIIGPISAYNKKGNEEFWQEESHLFLAVANQIAVAIDNARLMEELRKKADL